MFSTVNDANNSIKLVKDEETESDPYEIVDETEDENKEQDENIMKLIDADELLLVEKSSIVIPAAVAALSSQPIIPQYDAAPDSDIEFLGESVLKDDLLQMNVVVNNNTSSRVVDTEVHYCREQLDLKCIFDTVDDAVEYIHAYGRRNGCQFHKLQIHRLKFCDAPDVKVTDRILFGCSKCGMKTNKKAKESSTGCPARITLKHELIPNNNNGLMFRSNTDARSYRYKFNANLKNLIHNHRLAVLESSVITCLADVSSDIYNWVKEEVRGGTETASI